MKGASLTDLAMILLRIAEEIDPGESGPPRSFAGLVGDAETAVSIGGYWVVGRCRICAEVVGIHQ